MHARTVSYATRGSSIESEESACGSCWRCNAARLLMFTSCGWFFSDLAGIETIQVMRYAARVIDLQNELGLDPPRKEFLELMSKRRATALKKATAPIFFCAL